MKINNAINYCLNANKANFEISHFISLFWYEAGLKRSLDKVYEIITHSLFDTLAQTLELSITLYINENKLDILKEFEDFAKSVMCLDSKNLFTTQKARIYRVGVTNAADRGLDMHANWGVAIQIKHLSLDIELAESIISQIQSDRVIIVCKDAEKDIILSLLAQIGWKNKIQSIITESHLITWYEKAMRGKYANLLGDKLLETLCLEITEEFPSVKELPEILKERHYENIKGEL